MRRLLLAFTAIRLAFSVIGNIREIVGLVLLALIIGFGYFMYQNQMDVGASFQDISAIVRHVWDWLTGFWYWVKGLLPEMPDFREHAGSS